MNKLTKGRRLLGLATFAAVTAFVAAAPAQAGGVSDPPKGMNSPALSGTEGGVAGDFGTITVTGVTIIARGESWTGNNGPALSGMDTAADFEAATVTGVTLPVPTAAGGSK